MPDKPVWSGSLEEIAERLNSLPDPWVDRSLIEQLLGVGSRRAQQILAPCVTRRIGRNGLASREAVLDRLRCLVEADTDYYEKRRRMRLASKLEEFRRERAERPQVLVEAPASVTRLEIAGLPPGIAINKGEISIRFQTAAEALEKLLALAMAIGNDQARFERMAE